MKKFLALSNELGDWNKEGLSLRLANPTLFRETLVKTLVIINKQITNQKNRNINSHFNI